MSALVSAAPRRFALPALALVLAALAALVMLRLAGPLIALLRAEDAAASSAAAFAFFNLSLPRVGAGLLAGAALGLAGALFQAATRNPLASPDLLGVAAGAQLGVLLGLALPVLAPFAGPPLLFVCGLGAAAIAILAAGGFRASPLRLVLAGGACALLFGSLVTFTLAMFEQNVAGVALWGAGALYQPGATGLARAALWALAPLAALPFLLRPLAASTLGDDAAFAIGAPARPARHAAVVAASALTAVAVAIAGPIGFVGLLAPNVARGLGQRRLGDVALVSALVGAALLLAADEAAGALDLGSGISTGVAAALIGTPLLLFLALRGEIVFAPDRTEASGAARAPSVRPVALLLALLLVAAAAFGLMWGETFLSPARLLDALAGHDRASALIFGVRAPRLAVAALAGAMLAISGALLQSVLRNALAGPELIGVTQGAALATLSGALAFPLMGRAGAFSLAVLGGMGALAALLALNRRARFAPLPLALTGLAFSGLFAALTYALIVESSAQPARALIWLVGGTYGRSFADAAALAPWLILAAPALVLLARPLDLLALGDEQAANLGVPAARLRGAALVVSAALASAATAIVGPIGFVGLIAPHLARLMGFSDHGRRLLVAALVGALVTMIADILGRVFLAPVEIPAGAFTALVGAPYFLWLFLRRGAEGAPR